MTISFKDCLEYKIKDKKITIISDLINEINNTVAEIDNKYYYLGDETPNLLAAIIAYQEVTGLTISASEMHIILEENKL